MTVQTSKFGLDARRPAAVGGAYPGSLGEARQSPWRIPALPVWLLAFALACATVLAVALPGLARGQDSSPAQEEQVPAAKAEGEPRYAWERQFYGRFEGEEALLHNGSSLFGKLSMGDLNGDGLPDALLGKQDGTIAFFVNRGKPGRPVWNLAEEHILALAPDPKNPKTTVAKVISSGEHAAPALVDIDRDEDLDLFVGTGDGRILFFRNVGNPLLPAFALASDNFVSRSFGNNLVPTFSDIDKNRTQDLFIGNQRGEVFLLINQGTPRRAAFCVDFPPADALPDEEPPCRPVPTRVLSIGLESNATPALVDWDGDGDVDLFVGKSNGAIAYYENSGTPFKGSWQLRQERFLSIDQGGFAAPAFMDVNGDGRPDLLIGSSTNNVSLYTNSDLSNRMDVWKMSGNLFNIRRFGRSVRNMVLTSGDLDGDKDLDLMIGERDGRVLWLRNTGTPTEPAWEVASPNVIGTERENSAPLLVDLDGDGDLDLLVGGVDGRIWLLRNKGTPQQANFMLETTQFASIDVGNDSIPTMVDIDGDKDLDLFVGNRRGLVIFFRNEGTAQSPDYRLVSTRFANLKVRLNAAPAFFDWDNDKKPDMVVGSRDGRLVLSVNKTDGKSGDARQWEQKGVSWGTFQTHGYSAPLFADLNGDKAPDLLVGDADGNVRLWWNRGAASLADQENGAPPASAREDRGEEEVGALDQTVAGIPPTPDTQSQSGLTALAPTESTAAPTLSPTEQLLTTQAPQGPIPPVYTLGSRTFGGIQLEGPISPTFGDVDGDEDLDLVVGTGKGAVLFFRNEGDKESPKFTQVNDKLVGNLAGKTSSPFLADLDGDGKVDLLLGNESGKVLFFRNTGKNPDAPFEYVEDALTNINVGRNAAPAVARINDDEHTDLLIGNFSGKLLVYVRTGGAQSLNFDLSDRQFLGVDVGVASTPFAGDMDRDGTPEILIGSDQGKLVYYVKTPDDKKSPWGWSLGSEMLSALKFPFVSRPLLADLDDDGDMDLFVGEEKGRIYWYRNDAVASGAAPAQ